jgi:hypothetical protein
LMNLAIEPTWHLFEVSTTLLIDPSKQAVQRVLKVLADTPKGAVRIVRNRYPHSRQHQIVACHLWAGPSIAV